MLRGLNNIGFSFRSIQGLLTDPELRASQMHANHRYYQRYTRPDALARYVLDTAAVT